MTLQFHCIVNCFKFVEKSNDGSIISFSIADKKYTFGYRRFSLLGALINSVVLIGGSIYIISEAIGRILAPEHSNALGMIIFAIIGVIVNGYAAWKVSKGKTLNERVVSWRLLLLS